MRQEVGCCFLQQRNVLADATLEGQDADGDGCHRDCGDGVDIKEKLKSGGGRIAIGPHDSRIKKSQLG